MFFKSLTQGLCYDIHIGPTKNLKQRNCDNSPVLCFCFPVRVIYNQKIPLTVNHNIILSKYCEKSFALLVFLVGY